MVSNRRITEPLIYTDNGPILVTYNVPCHCVREKLKGIAGRA